MTNLSKNVYDYTDVSGGYSPSILNAIRCAVHTSNTVKLNQQTDNEYKSLDHKDAFRLATLGGAQGNTIHLRGTGSELFQIILYGKGQNLPIFSESVLYIKSII